MFEIQLDRGAGGPLFVQIADTISRRIESGELAPGSRLPTVRELSDRLSVTRVTAHKAYVRLQEKGQIESTVGRGTFVTRSLALAPPPAAGPVPDVAAWNSPENAGLLMLLNRDVGSMALAEPDPRLAPAEVFMEVVQKAAGDAVGLLRYGATEGDPTLRARIAALLAERGVRCNPDQILMTTGCTQALSLITQALARPGERVLVEQPTYFGFLSILRALQIQAVAVPTDDRGPVPESFERAILRERPRFFYTMPTFHNPTGVTMTRARREAILALSARYALPLVEDDIFRCLDYGPSPQPPLKAMDEKGLVFYVDGFSKSLLPGLRIGFVAAPPAHHARLSTLLYSSTLGTAHILQRALSVFLDEGGFQAHLKRVIPIYKRRRDALMAALAKHMPEGVRWTVPQGGFCCWVSLPRGSAPTELIRAAWERGVAFTPGHLFEAQPSRSAHMRLCFGTQTPETIRAAVRVLGEILVVGLRRGTAVRSGRTAPLV